MGPDYVGNQCDQCFTVTIASCDGVEQPQSFEVGSVDCFSVCSPSGDFILGSLSTGVCDTVRKQVVWKNASGPIPCVGMSATDQPTFRICGSGSPQRFFIRLIAHCGTICQNPCQSAIIDIP